MNIAAVILGFAVFQAAKLDDVPLVSWVFENPIGLTSVILASLSLVLLWYLLLKGKTKVLRILAGFQVTMILVAISYAHFPNFIRLKDGNVISLFDSIAPLKTVQSLGWALVLGSFLILPFLGYLFYKFQKKEE